MNCIMEQDEIKKKIEREILLKKIATVPDGQKLCFEDEKKQKEFVAFLERLIFFKVDEYRFPVWTGSFLKKIDLSQLDFKNVCFDIRCFEKLINQNNSIDLNVFKMYYSYLYPSQTNEFASTIFDEEDYELKTFDNDSPAENFNGYIDFSDTNIRLDFLYLMSPSAYNVDFSNVDLSRSNAYCLKSENCNFENCNLYVVPYQTINSSFKNNPLTGFVLDERYTEQKVETLTANDRYTDLKCDFTNTGVQINLKNELPFTKEEYDFVKQFLYKYRYIIKAIKKDLIPCLYSDIKKDSVFKELIEMRQEFDSFRREFYKILELSPYKGKYKRNMIENGLDDYYVNFRSNYYKRYDLEDYPGAINMRILMDLISITNSYDTIENYIKSGYLNGCYVNGYLVVDGLITDKQYEKKDNVLASTIIKKELAGKFSFFESDFSSLESSNLVENNSETKEDENKPNVLKRRRKF